MRTITELIVHCSAVRPDCTSSAREIDAWHRALGWSGIGYHYVIRRDGSVENGRPLQVMGAHCQGHNRHSIGICYEGGLDAQGQPSDTRTPAQKATLLRLLKQLKNIYPNSSIHGHYEFAPKACPCFDVRAEYGGL